MEEKNIVEEIRKFVEEECKKPTSKYGHEPYELHFVPVVKQAKKLAEEFEADLEVVELAAWLHDIGSIVHGRKDHHITGAEIAEKKLRELNYPEDKIQRVKKCILNHRGSVDNCFRSVEEKIIADADTIDNFNNIAGPITAAVLFEGKNQREATQSAREKLIRKYNKLNFQESKDLIKPKFEAAMLLLADEN